MYGEARAAARRLGLPVDRQHADARRPRLPAAQEAARVGAALGAERARRRLQAHGARCERGALLAARGDRAAAGAHAVAGAAARAAWRSPSTSCAAPSPPWRWSGRGAGGEREATAVQLERLCAGSRTCARRAAAAAGARPRERGRGALRRGAAGALAAGRGAAARGARAARDRRPRARSPRRSGTSWRTRRSTEPEARSCAPGEWVTACASRCATGAGPSARPSRGAAGGWRSPSAPRASWAGASTCAWTARRSSRRSTCLPAGVSTRRRGLVLLALALACGGLAASRVSRLERESRRASGRALPVVVARPRRRGRRADPARARSRCAGARPLRAARRAGVGGGGRRARAVRRVPRGGYVTAGRLSGERDRPAARAAWRRASGRRGAVAGGRGLRPPPGARVDVLVSSEPGAGPGRTRAGARGCGAARGGRPTRATLRRDGAPGGVLLAARRTSGARCGLLPRPGGDRRQRGRGWRWGRQSCQPPIRPNCAVLHPPLGAIPDRSRSRPRARRRHRPAAQQRPLGQSRKRPFSTTPGTHLRPLSSSARSTPARDLAVEDQVALVGAVRVLAVHPQPGVGRELGKPPARVAPAEADHLDRQPRPLAEALHALGRLGHDHEAARGGDHDLLAQERAAAALDEPEPRVDLVGAVERQVERRLAVQLHDLDAGLACQLAGALRSHRRADAVALGEHLDHRPDGPPGAEPDGHPGLHERRGGRCGRPWRAAPRRRSRRQPRRRCGGR